VPRLVDNYGDRVNNLIAALVNAKAVSLKLLIAAEEACALTQLYKVNLGKIERIYVKDALIEFPEIIVYPNAADVFKNLRYDDVFNNAQDNFEKYLLKAAEDFKILK